MRHDSDPPDALDPEDAPDAEDDLDDGDDHDDEDDHDDGDDDLDDEDDPEASHDEPLHGAGETQPADAVPTPHHRPGPFSPEADPHDAAHGIAPPLRSGRFEKKARNEAADGQARALVDRLLGLNDEVFARFAILNTELAEAVRLARTVRKGSARARQARFVSTLIKALPPGERGPLVEQVRRAQEGRTQEVLVEKAWARWRDHLVASPDAGVADLLALEPDLDRQRLRQLARQAAKEQAEGKAPKAARQLYQVLREALAEAPPAPPEG